MEVWRCGPCGLVMREEDLSTTTSTYLEGKEDGVLIAMLCAIDITQVNYLAYQFVTCSCRESVS